MLCKLYKRRHKGDYFFCSCKKGDKIIFTLRAHTHTHTIFRSWTRNKAEMNLLSDRAYRRCETGEDRDDNLFEETDGDR